MILYLCKNMYIMYVCNKYMCLENITAQIYNINGGDF